MLNESQQRSNHNRDTTNEHDEVDVGVTDLHAFPEHWIDTGDQEHTSHNHGARVQQRTDWRRSGHSVGQPRMQWELTALADTGNEQCNCTPRESTRTGLARHGPSRQTTDVETRDSEIFLGPTIGREEQDGGTDEQSHVANTNSEESFERSSRVGFFFPPVTDQHERAQTHDFPTENQLHHVGGKNHAQHAGGEQCECGKEVGVATIATQVFERVDLHQA